MNELIPLDILMLAYGEEPHLAAAVEAVLTSEGVDVRLVLVDNGCTTTAVDDLPKDPRLTLLRSATNLGFTGGMNLAAAQGDRPTLALVNSDAIVRPDALAHLARAVRAEDVAITTASVRLADDPARINSAGNPVHVLGLSWAGGLGEPAERYGEPRDVPSGSGACMAVRREVWEELGGFCEEFFAYQEDCELSWRCWLTGRAVRYVPAAVALHHYEFSRNELKMYLLDRNRLLFVLTCWGPRMLALLAAPLLASEVAMLLVATVQGWGRQKLRGWAWLLRNARWVASRRRAVQRSRVVPDGALTRLLTATFDPAAIALPAATQPAQAVLRAWWFLVRRWV